MGHVQGEGLEDLVWSVGWCFPCHSTHVEHVQGMFKVRDWRIRCGVWGGVSHVIACMWSVCGACSR